MAGVQQTPVEATPQTNLRSSRRRARQKRRGVPPLRGLLFLAVLLAVWQLVQHGQSAYFPRPSLWWGAVTTLWADGQLGPAVVATLKTFILALVIATVLGSVIGALAGRVRRLDRTLGPSLEYCRVMPAAAVVPLAVLFAGYTQKMKIAVVVFAAIWPILLQVRSASRGLNPILLDIAKSMHLGRMGTVRKVLFPSLVPAILLGVRVAAPTVLIIVLLVEILTQCPTYFGRLNRVGDAPELLLWEREATEATGAPLPAAGVQVGPMPTGVFRQERRPEYTERYAELCARQGGRYHGSQHA